MDQADKVNGWLDRHPKITLAMCGAAFAISAFQVFETGGWFVKAFRDAHRAQVASEAMRAVSESLGG